MISGIGKLVTVALLWMAALGAPASFAQDAVLEQARSAGIVGEMYTGYIGVADASRANADLRRRVDETNAKRLAAYASTAERTGQPVATIAALTAEKLIARAEAGEAVLPGEGQEWVLKP
jgi:uncharacterized protein YdbL (DUF1318 family)